MEINCYTDASYSKEKSLSVVAYKIGDNDINVLYFQDVKNTQSEIMGIQHCIRVCNEEYPDAEIINIYTDCQNAWKHEWQPNVNLIKVKGHQPKRDMSPTDLIFKQVDKMAIKMMRQSAGKKCPESVG